MVIPSFQRLLAQGRLRAPGTAAFVAAIVVGYRDDGSHAPCWGSEGALLSDFGCDRTAAKHQGTCPTSHAII